MRQLLTVKKGNKVMKKFNDIVNSLNMLKTNKILNIHWMGIEYLILGSSQYRQIYILTQVSF